MKKFQLEEKYHVSNFLYPSELTLVLLTISIYIILDSVHKLSVASGNYD